MICVSSSKSGVGKTTIMVNPAFRFAASSLRIVAVDPDLSGIVVRDENVPMAASAAA